MDITRNSRLASLLRNRLPFFLARAITLAGFIFTILVGLLGTPVGGRNFAIIFVWIAWWTALKLVLIPFGGRIWCSVCPIPAPGEWLQRRFLISSQGKTPRKRRRWPKLLRGSWLHLGGFAFMGMFSAVLLTKPTATAWILLFLLVFAFGISLVFERRAFCRYLCPMGGFIGWYAQLAPIEVRARDHAICAAHNPKTCYTGCAEGVGCPWGLVPATNTQNLDCGLCMECQRTCPHSNMAVRLRPFGGDLNDRSTKRTLDRAWFGLFLLACAPVYSVVMLGPWGPLKMAAYSLGSVAWFQYALGFLTITLCIVPGMFWLATRLGWHLDDKSTSFRDTFIQLSHTLAPLGLMSWVAFTMAFAFGKLAYVWPVLSDPFGWGWNLFGTAYWPWQPYLVNLTPILQIAALVGGLLWTVVWVRRYVSIRQAVPVLVYCLTYTVSMLWLLL